MASESSRAELFAEGERILRICNACRYCEGYCAVFPALERRWTFKEDDVSYLANLCHGCGSCYDACPYVPPHEFAVNLPRTLAEIRAKTYEDYTWPAVLAGLFQRNSLAMSLVTSGSLTLCLLLTSLLADTDAFLSAHSAEEGAFYALIPHSLMVVSFGGAFLYALVAMAMGFLRFWRDTGLGYGAILNPRALLRASLDVLTLGNLGGGGDGCIQPDEAPSLARRRFHHATFYGFALCFAATSVASLYHNLLGWEAPYEFLSLPVLLGTLGGTGLLVGPAGLLWLKARRDPRLVDPGQVGMEVGLLVLLFLTSATGLALLALRETSAMGIVLVVHLGLVMAFFLMMPYGKFVHGVYRAAALLRNALEGSRETPSPR